MVYYGVTGTITFTVDAAIDKKIESKITAAMKKALMDTWKEEGHMESDDVEIETDLEYEKYEDD